MASYAHVVNGVVIEVITPSAPLSSLYTPAFVASLIECDSTPGVAQGWTYANGVFAPPVAPTLTPAQSAAVQYDAAIALGLAVTSTGTPALNDTYGVQRTDTDNIMAEAQFIQAFSEFTNGSTTALLWSDSIGTSQKTFTSTAQFMAFAKAAAQYVAACKLAAQAIALGQTATFPSNAVTIP